MAAPSVEPPGAAGASVPPGQECSLPQPEPRANLQPQNSERSLRAQDLATTVDPLVVALAEASRQFDGTGPDPERNCWMAVHRHIHGVLPSEYDIRGIDEDLYLEVLALRRRLDLEGG